MNTTEQSTMISNTTQFSSTTLEGNTTYPPTTSQDISYNGTTVGSTNATSEPNNIQRSSPPSDRKNIGGVVGGVTGGVVAVVVMIVIITIMLRKRNHRKGSKSGKSCTLPRIEDLEIRTAPGETSVPYADKPYENLTENGETDPNTDPSVDSDGYLKKSKLVANGNKPPRTYYKEKGRDKPRNSMPAHRAPAPPGDSENDPNYSEAHLGEVKLGDSVTGYTNAKIPDKKQPNIYLDLEKDDNSKVGSKSKAKHKKTKNTHHDKLYENEDTKQNANEDTPGLYENVKDNQHAPYYNVVKSQDKGLVQDNYYEM
ncbi:hypothetical protein ACF0H5_007756 [Mactra antiquata]